MRKLIFLLLLAVILNGFVFAVETAHPPWDISLEAVMFENNADNLVVTSDAVLVLANPVTVELSSFQAVMVSELESAIQPHSGLLRALSRIELSCASYTATNYHLRC
jgi:hypothetical protein